MKKEQNNPLRNPEFLAGEEFKVAQLTFVFNKVDTFEQRLAVLKEELSKKKLTECEICDLGAEKKHEIYSALNSEKHYLENKLRLLQDRQDLITPELIENHYKDLSDFEQNRVTASLDKKLKTLPKLKSRLEHIQSRLAQLESGEDEFDVLNSPSKTTLNRKAIYLALLSLFSLGDAILGYNAMLILGEGIPNIALAWLTALTAAATGIGAHFSGKILAKNGFTKEFVTALLISFSFVFTLIWIRTDIQSSAILSVLNAAFFAMAALISYRRYLTQDYWNKENLIVRLKSKEASLVSKIEALENDVALDKEAIQIKLRNRAKELSAQDILHNKQRMRELQTAFEGMLKIQNSYDRRVDMLVEAAINRKKDKAERSKNSVFANIKSLFTPKKFAQNGTMMIAAMLFLSACTPKKEVTDVVVLMDLTEQHSAFPNSETVLHDIGSFNGGQIILSAITDTHLYPYHVVALESPKSYLMQIKEEEDGRLNNFENQFKIAYASLAIPKGELQYSYVFSALNTHLVKLSKSGAEHKKFLCYSDLLEHSTRFSFYSYRQNPKAIMKAYDAIVSRFEGEYEDVKAMNLDGVSITILHSPEKSEDALYYYTSQFWEKFFKDKGATSVKFEPLTLLHNNKNTIADGA